MAKQCEETDYDRRGDCDGKVRIYITTKYMLGKRPGERVDLCKSHGKQAEEFQEARRP